MFEELNSAKRIELAKAKMEKVLDHFLYLLELHANNALVVYSPILSSQITPSYAANAFNVFQRSMHQFEIVRLCALWDGPDAAKENVPTVIELIDDDAIIDMLAEETRQHWAMDTMQLFSTTDEEAIKRAELGPLVFRQLTLPAELDPVVHGRLRPSPVRSRMRSRSKSAMAASSIDSTGLANSTDPRVGSPSDRNACHCAYPDALSRD
jgi:hypothetical protein